MAGKVKVTEGIWKAIKILLNNGAKYNEIKEVFPVSNTVISFTKNSETYEEFRHKLYVTSGGYRRKMKAEAEKKAQHETVKDVPASEQNDKEVKYIPENRQTVVVQASHYMLEEQKKTNELLTEISKKLATIVCDLYGVKE